MNSFKIYSIIALMSLALLGIVVIQVSLLNKSLEANEEYFDTGVNQALHDVVSRLEAKRLETHIVRWEGSTELLDQFARELPGAEEQTFVFRSDVQEIKAWQYLDSENIDVEVHTDSIQESSTTVVYMSGQAMENAGGKSLRIELQGDPSKVKMMQSTLRKLESVDPNFTAHIDSVFLGEALARSFHNQGIDLDYEFAIRDPQNAGVPGILAGSRPDQQEPRYHEVDLFPNARAANTPTLSVMFPHQSTYLLKSIWREAFGSLVFSAIILLCFGLTVRTIFRQKRLSDMKNDFINNMTHELKTPIATIGLAAETLSQQAAKADPAFIGRYSSIIREENSRINRQVERVLQAAQFDRREIHLNREPVHLADMLRRTVAHFQLQIEDRGGQLRTDIEGDPVVTGDAEHLANVLSNLLDNANKYSPEAPDIEVAVRRTGNQVEMSVSDQGMGIPRQIQQDIFTRFYRASTGNLHEVKGFGLGLSYVREVVEAHGGEVTVHSKPGEGSTFTVFLPVADAPVV